MARIEGSKTPTRRQTTHPRRTQRRDAAEDRSVARAVLGPGDQLRILDIRLGECIGATKERQRLLLQLAKTANKNADKQHRQVKVLNKSSKRWRERLSESR